jgi:hypothetical protein
MGWCDGVWNQQWTVNYKKLNTIFMEEMCLDLTDGNKSYDLTVNLYWCHNFWFVNMNQVWWTAYSRTVLIWHTN